MSQVSQTDYVVMGAGVAGLRAAVELAAHGEVLVATKEAAAESNTHYAQGGIAVALGGEEDVALHLKDTVGAGDGLVHKAAARVLVAEGPARVTELMQCGARFDRASGELLRTREGAHSLPRILHANGDATGAEISRALVALARGHERIHFAEWTTVTALETDGDRVAGVTLLDREGGVRRVAARSVLVAAGGAGQVYSDTTNPPVATGDGIALAAEAGAALADMEFYQFHPTAFAQPGAPRFLLSEALRGEGAYLRNDRGERFMERVHPLLELAPRDVVARAIAREGMGGRPVHLDMRHVKGIDLHERFPGISAFLAKYGLDLARDLIPVRPAAHYLMGGVQTDLEGRSTVRGLYAAGEAACTGVHGANRLASNSLLEGLVFGARAAQAMLRDGLTAGAVDGAFSEGSAPTVAEEAQIEAAVRRLQSTMWMNAGLLRDGNLLHAGLKEQAACEAVVEQIAERGRQSRALAEARALCRVARAILTPALAREESRGAHFRSDFPKRDDARFQRHSVLRMSDGDAVTFEAW